jgi:hypothetical protein
VAEVRRRFDPGWLAVLGLSVFAWAPLLAPGYFHDAHDARHALFFLNQFDQAIREGVWIPRWGPDFALGYGYPLFLLYSPLAYYVAEVFLLLGATITAAVKWTYGVAFLLSAWGMYGFGRRLFGRGGGLLAAVLYVYAPYHLLDIYVRGSFAEFCALGVLPWVFWAFTLAIEEGRPRQVAAAAVSFGALILTHNATALLATPLLAAYVLLRIIVRWKAEHPLAAAGRGMGAAVLGGGLVGFFVIPMLLERQFVALAQWTSGSFDYARHFVYPSQFLSPFWGYGYAGEGTADAMSFQLGVASVVLALVAGIWGWRGRERWTLRFFLATSLVLILLMLPLSAALWEALPLAALVQFPWRLLALTAYTIAVASAAIPGALGLEGRGGFAVVALLAVAAVAASLPYAVPEHTPRDERSEEVVAIIDFETFYPPDRVGMTRWVEEQPQDTPLVADYLALRPLQKVRILEGNGEAETIEAGAHQVSARVRGDGPLTVQFLTYYFPGWQGFVDGVQVAVRPEGPQGLIALDVPAGEHEVRLIFGSTPARSAGLGVSLVSLLIWIGLLVLGAVGARKGGADAVP